MAFSLYYIEESYCNFLRSINFQVAKTKESRPFIGIVLQINGYNYYAPLTSPKPKHLTMKNQTDFIKIDGGRLGAINLNNMIPVPSERLQKISTILSETDSQERKAYIRLLRNQLSWCNKTENKTAICKKAEKLYNSIVQKTARPQLVNRCCDFLALEQQCKQYCQQHHLQNPQENNSILS